MKRSQKERKINFAEDLEKSLSSDLNKINTQISEPVMDSILNDGLLKDIPIIGTAVNLYKAGQTFQALHFVQKIHRVLFYLQELSEKERSGFINSLDSKNKHKVFERILYIVDKLDETQKADIIGQLLIHLVKGNLTQQLFFRLASIVNNSHISDLTYFYFVYKDHGALSYGDEYDKFIQENQVSMSVEYMKEGLVTSGLLLRKLKKEDNSIKAKLYGGDPTLGSSYKFEEAVSIVGEALLKYGYKAYKYS